MTSSLRLDRRQTLLRAAREVATQQGLPAVTVRAVAKAAKMSPGSVLYHFSGIDDLVLAAVEGVLADFDLARRALSESIPDVRERMAAFINLGIPDQISDDLVIVYESLAYMQTRPQLAMALRTIVERQVEMYQSTIEIGIASGAFSPTMPAAGIARHLVALEDGYDLYPVLGLRHDRALARESMLRVAELMLGTTLPGGTAN